jgi:hypothetical protein
MELTTAGGTAAAADPFTAIATADVYAYTAPTVTSVFPVSGDTDGAYTVTLRGTHFGPARTFNTAPATRDAVNFTYIDGPGGADDDYFPCTEGNVTALGEIECTLGAGVGLHMDVRLVMGTSAGTEVTDTSGTALFGYTAPTATLVDPAVSADPATITITGNNFGQNADMDKVSVAVGPRNCVVSAVTKTTIVCLIAAGGAGFGWDVNVTIGLQTEEQKAGVGSSFSYPGPTFTAIVPSTGNSPTTDQNNAITIYGTNFGTTDSEMTINFLATGPHPIARVCDSPEIDRSSCSTGIKECVVCDRPVGVGADIEVQGMIGPSGQEQPSSIIHFSYAAPDITSLDPSTGIDTMHNDFLTIEGTDFGPDGNDAYAVLWNPTKPVVTIDPLGVSGGPVACPVDDATGSSSGQRRLSRTEVVCRLPRWVGANLDVEICVVNQCSTLSGDQISYDSPDITLVNPTGVKPDGSDAERTITITGN